MKSRTPINAGGRQHPESNIDIKWNASLTYAGPYPTPGKRFYRLETLNNALQQYVHQKSRFLWAGLNSAVKGAGIVSLLFDLIYEDTMRLVYRVTAFTSQRKRIPIRLVVAKNHEECSATLAREYGILGSLHSQAPGRIFLPLQQGLIYLPDRHHRKEVERELFAYLGTPPVELIPLYAASPSQFGPHGPQPLRYSVKDTEALKCALISLLAACYDEQAFSGIDINDLTPESFSVVEGSEKRLSLMLTQCPMIRKRLPSGRFLQKLLFGTLRSGKTVMPVAPARPDQFFQALAKEITEEKARMWCRAFMDRYTRHLHPPQADQDIDLPGKDYVEALAASAGL